MDKSTISSANSTKRSLTTKTLRNVSMKHSYLHASTDLANIKERSSTPKAARLDRS